MKVNDKVKFIKDMQHNGSGVVKDLTNTHVTVEASHGVTVTVPKEKVMDYSEWEKAQK